MVNHNTSTSSTPPSSPPSSSNDNNNNNNNRRARGSANNNSQWEQVICQRLERRRRQGTLRQWLPLEQLLDWDSHPDDVVEEDQQASRPAWHHQHHHEHDHQQKQQQQQPPIVYRTYDFSSNDYLGLAHCPHQRQKVQEEYDRLAFPQHDPSQHPSQPITTLGATGSRLLSGDSIYARQLEQRLASLHHRPAAVLFNSGYDANLSVLSSIPVLKRQRRRHEEDAGVHGGGVEVGVVVVQVFYDELVHNSIRMGMSASRLSSQEDDEIYSFQHNQVQDLQRQLKRASTLWNTKNQHSNTTTTTTTTCLRLIVVESVYSMDGDIAPLREILDVAMQWNAMVVVDEAHGLGVYGCTNEKDLLYDPHMDGDHGGTTNSVMGGAAGGTGVLAALHLEQHPALLCSIHTFGKAAGCHGAVVATRSWYALYLWNYAMPLVYSTALPLHSLVAISCAYDSMTTTSNNGGEERRRHLFQLVRLFQTTMRQALSSRQQREQAQRRASIVPPSSSSNPATTASNPTVQVSLWPSPSPIQALRISLLPTSSPSSSDQAFATNATTTATTTTTFPQNGNECVVQFCQYLYHTFQLRLYPIRAPTVPVGTERVRILLHAHNTPLQVLQLVQCLMQALDAVFPNNNQWQVATTSSNITTTASTRVQDPAVVVVPTSRL
jgi:8-amino-7-oxononanoate synthase